jgi:hypothetical protein
MRAGRALVGCVVTSTALLLACSSTVETGDYASRGGTPVPITSGGSSTGTAPSSQAMLVDVDTNRTMVAQGGDGVGVFSEYAAGGHWHVFWTCDTNRTNLDCGFNVGLTTTGAITNAAGQSLDANDALSLGQAASGQVSVQTQTSTLIQGVTFDTAPGSAVALDAQIDGQRDGRILFFVQDGKVNGGYQGALADPLTLEPSSP